MNRVVLCGRLAARPKSSYTPTGVAMAHFTLLISQDGAGESALLIPCFAQRVLAQELVAWGERGHRLNLEGRLRSYTEATQVSGYVPMCIAVDAAYFVDPVMDPALTIEAECSDGTGLASARHRS